MIPVKIREWDVDEESYHCPICVYYKSNIKPVKDEKNQYYCENCGNQYLIEITGKTVLR